MLRGRGEGGKQGGRRGCAAAGQLDNETRAGELYTVTVVAANVVRLAHEDEGDGVDAGGWSEGIGAMLPAVELYALGGGGGG